MLSQSRCNKVRYFSNCYLIYPNCTFYTNPIISSALRVGGKSLDKYFKKLTNIQRSQKGQFWADGQKLTLYLK